MYDHNRLKEGAKKTSDILLKLFARKISKTECLDSAVDELARWLGCRCVGIRLIDSNGHVPYAAHQGFSRQFLEVENNLQIQSDECACLRTLRSNFCDADMSVVTPHGSFCCEDSTRFITGLTEKQKSLYRGICVETGFKTICIIPIRYRDEILGAIHLADEREAVISSKNVQFIETISFIIGEAVSRFKVEQAFEESEQKYEALIKNSLTGIYLVQEGRVVFSNQEFADIHGYPVDEIIGLDSQDLVHPEDRKLVQTMREMRLTQIGWQTEYEARGLKKNGETITVLRRNTLIEHNGKPAILGNLIDITERKKNEIKLRENSELLETIFSNIHFCIAYMDTDFNFIRVNRAYAEADNRTPDFFIDRNHFELYPNAEIEEIFRKTAETAEPYYAFARPFTYAHNPERGITYWDWTLYPLKDAAENTAALLLGLVNITDRKKAEDALLQTHDELEKRAEQLARLTSELALTEERERRRLAGILHDHLQQMLVGAKLNLETISCQMAENQKKILNTALNLLDDSIKTSRSITAELSPPILYQNGLTAGLEWLARWMLEKYNFKIELKIDPEISVDHEDLTVVLFHSVREMLFNAVKHAGVNSAEVSFSKEGVDCIRMVVRDRGVGFEPNRILRCSRQSEGFGLFAIRERVELLGGRLEVESAPGKGTSFTLIAPIIPEIISPPTFSKIGRKIRVLLVDDHIMMRQGLSMVLNTQSDIEVVGEAQDGEEAIKVAKDVVPDVILMDIGLPKIGGIEATRIIHDELPQIRIIALSMYEDREMASSAFQAGAEVYLTKSGNSDALLSAIRSKV